MTLLQMQMRTLLFDSQVYLLVHLVEDILLMGPIYIGGYFLWKDIWKLLKILHQKVKVEGRMSEGYLLQEVMRILHDKIAQFVDFAPRVSKEEEDEHIRCKGFYEILIYDIP